MTVHHFRGRTKKNIVWKAPPFFFFFSLSFSGVVLDLHCRIFRNFSSMLWALWEQTSSFQMMNHVIVCLLKTRVKTSPFILSLLGAKNILIKKQEKVPHNIWVGTLCLRNCLTYKWDKFDYYFNKVYRWITCKIHNLYHELILPLIKTVFFFYVCQCHPYHFHANL